MEMYDSIKDVTDS